MLARLTRVAVIFVGLLLILALVPTALAQEPPSEPPPGAPLDEGPPEGLVAPSPPVTWTNG